MPNSYLDTMPLWAFFALPTLIALLAIEVGFRTGARRRRVAEHESESPVGAAVAATLGLLAFLLAFSFGAAASRFDSRKSLLLEEVNAIGTAYLRAGLLREPHRTDARNLLREYVDVRASLALASIPPERIPEAIASAETLQEKLWTHAAAIAESDRVSPIDALFVSALNEVFDLHTKRVVFAMQYRTPLIVFAVLILVSALAMGMVGFQFGLAGKRSVHANVALVIAFAAVLWLIFDLDRPTSGWLTVSQQPMVELQQNLNAHTQ